MEVMHSSFAGGGLMFCGPPVVLTMQFHTLFLSFRFKNVCVCISYVLPQIKRCNNNCLVM